MIKLFTKVVGFCKESEIEYDFGHWNGEYTDFSTIPSTNSDYLRLHLDNNIMIIDKKQNKCSVTLYMDIHGDDGVVMELGNHTQDEVIGIIQGAMILNNSNDLK